MSQYFECLRCGVVSPIESQPPRCASCGYGTGVVHSRKPARKGSAPDGNQGTGDRKDTNKPDDPAAVLTTGDAS